MALKQRKLSELKLVDEAQPRVCTSLEVIADYTEILREGGSLPPITVFGDYVADGFHRYAAHESAKLTTISTITHRGGLREPVLHSCQANAAHGLRRTNADKRRAVLKLLADPEWQKWSDRRIAKAAAVSNAFVSDLRAEAIDSPRILQRKVERGASSSCRQFT